MSESKHTPGPWKVEDGGFVGGPVGFGRICQLWNKWEEDFRNADANARLIAAAPDMYSALKDLLKFPATIEERTACVNRALSAIAKAEGRS